MPPKLTVGDEPFELLQGRPWYLRARLVLLLLAWCVALFGGLTLHVLCDVFQGLAIFPLIPSLFSAVLFNGVGACITAYVGSLTVAGFRLYQPFVGGQSFVVMQAFGYGTVCLAEALVCVYIQASRSAHARPVALSATSEATFADVTASAALHPLQHFGVLSILGAFPFIANITLMTSLMFFVQPPLTPGAPNTAAVGGRRVRFERSSAAMEKFLHHWSKSPRREMALVIALSAVVVVFAIVGALVPAARRTSLTLYLALQAINAFLIHVCIGWRSTPGYHLFMPRLSSLRCTATQFVLWTLFVVMMYWCVGELSTSALPASPTRLLALAIGGVGITTGLMLFVRIAFEDLAPSERGSHGGNNSHLGSRTMLSRYGPSTLTCASFLHACMIWALVACDTTPPIQGRVPATLELDGYHVAQSVAALFMMSFPPATHLMGRLVIGEPFSIWQPFRGCLPFIAMQGIGWTAFGGSFVAYAAHLSNAVAARDRQSILLLAALCVFSQAMIHGSLIVFAPGDDSDASALASMIPTLPKAASRVTSMLRKKRPVSLVAAVLNGEMLVALLMMVTVLTLRVVCDVGVMQLKALSSVTAAIATDQQQHPLTPATLHFIAFVTTWMGVATVPLAHVSGRDKGIDVFRPFGGSGAYVALQAIGWTLYSASLLVTILAVVVQSAATMDASSTSWMTWTGGFGAVVNRKHLASPLADLPPCWFCVDAMLWALPLALVVVSVAVETEKNWAKHSDEEEVWDAESRLLSLVAEAMPHKKDQALAAELIKLLTASQRRHKTPWSAYSIMEAKSASRQGEALHVRRARIKEQQGTATLIICMTCVGTAVLFIVGAVWIGREPQVLSKGFAFAAFVLTTITCFTTHYVYGTLVHGDRAYAFFMPFSGGISFVALQAVGWAFYTAATVLVLHTFLLSDAQLHTYLIAAIFSVSAQALILGSIPRYEGRVRGKERTTLERNAEALVAGLLFVASFSYAQAHRSWGAQPHDAARSAGGWNDYASSSALVPLVVSCVTSCFAVPLTVAAIHRSFRGHGPFAWDEHDAADADEEPHTSGASTTHSGKGHPTHTHHAQLAILIHRVGQLVGMTTALLLVLLPVALAFVLHFAVNLSVGSFGVETATTAWLYVTVSIGLTTLCGVFVDMLGSRGTITSSSKALRHLRVTMNTFAMFSIPTYVVVGPLSLPFVLPQSMGAQMVTAHALLLVLVGDFAIARFALSIAEVCGLAFTLTYHLSEGGAHSIGWGVEVVADIVLPLLMLWYHRTFVGAPETRGQLVSPAFVKRLKAMCCFDDVADYFQMRVLVDRSKAVGDAAPCWESSPVIFSYHPHGVFPATTLLLPHTKVWRNAIRLPSMSEIKFPRLSVHGAGVIFRVPFMRDFVMALGARVVTRRAIEASLNQNNSVMIVTGGQAEMLHTKYSDTEMHLVTHHLGFLRLAVRHQVPVVPIVCFAEHNVMDNIHIPWLQRKMLGLIGFPFPTVPHGRWYLPLPNRTPLCVVVGAPVNPPHGLVVDDAEGVQAFAAVYIDEVKRLFYKYRAECGYPDMELVLHGKKEHSHKKHAAKK